MCYIGFRSEQVIAERGGERTRVRYRFLFGHRDSRPRRQVDHPVTVGGEQLVLVIRVLLPGVHIDSGAGAGQRRGQPIELGSRLFCLDAGRIIYRTHVFGDKRNVHIDSIPDGFARPLSGA